MRRISPFVLVVVLAAVVAAGCGSDAVVARVNGRAITNGDVEALLAGSTAPRSNYVGVMELLVVDEVLARAARDQLGVAVAADRVQAQIDEYKAGLEGTGRTYEEALAEQGFTEEFVAARARIQVLAADIVDRVEPDLDTWVIETLRAADIRVDPEYGEWRNDPGPAIYPPGS